jgi:hypothetical protein
VLLAWRTVMSPQGGVAAAVTAPVVPLITPAVPPTAAAVTVLAAPRGTGQLINADAGNGDIVAEIGRAAAENLPIGRL